MTTGASLGMARGSITIDISQLEGVRQRVQQVGAQINRAMTATAQGARVMETNLVRASNAIGKMQIQLVGIGATGGILTGLGLRAAGSFEEAGIQLEGMVGSAEEATRITEGLRKRAAQAGLPFSDMLSVATQLLPTLEGNTQELEKWLPLIRRVAALNPQEGLGGAAFAVRESLSSGGTDLVSLAERFNISRVALRQELAANGGDFAAALDQVLARMGITETTAERMGRTFNASLRGARDAAVQLLAEGMTPLLQQLTPILQESAVWLAQLRETNPEIATLGAGMAVAAATGAPLLLLFNQLVEAGRTLKSLGLLSILASLGVKGGLAAIGVGAAVYGAQGASRAIGSATGNEALANTGVSDLFASVKRGFTEMRITAYRIFSDITQFLTLSGAQIANAMRNMVASVLDAIPGGGGQAARLRAEGAGMLADAEIEVQRQRDILNRRTLAALGGPAALSHQADPAIQGRVEAEARANQEVIDAKVEWAKQISRIERDAARARIESARQYEQQRGEIIHQYEQTIARDAEDFARQRARQQEALNQDLADLAIDAAERDAGYLADLEERIGDAREDSAERIADIEADYAKQRERSAADHQDRLLDAAGRLDAAAVAAEQRRYARERQEAEADLKERVDNERENLQERIDEDTKAYQERLEDARRADAKRTNDLIASLAEQQRIEDEDRAVRLGRMQADHAAQLAELARAQVERMQQIDLQVRDEKMTVDSALRDRLTSLGVHHDKWIEEQEKWEALALQSFKDNFWDPLNEMIGPMTKPDPGGTQWPSLQDPFVNLNRLPEKADLTNQYLSDILRELQGNPLPGVRMAALGAPGGSGRNLTVTFAAGSIRVDGGGASAEQNLRRVVVEVMTDVYERMAQ